MIRNTLLTLKILRECIELVKGHELLGGFSMPYNMHVPAPLQET